MGDKTGIAWTDSTWNLVVGCSLVSPGCTHCYAMKQAGRITMMNDHSHYVGTVTRTKAGYVWTGKLNLAPWHIILAPLQWIKPRMIFVNSMSDLFHEDMPEEWIDLAFAIMAMAPQHIFQVLTKRGANMQKQVERVYKTGSHLKCAEKLIADGRVNSKIVIDRTQPLPHVWLGISAEDQRRADERVPYLEATLAEIRYISAEPLLSSIDIRRHLNGLLHWIIIGGESGLEARPMDLAWARRLVQDCQEAAVKVFVKQMGDNPISELPDDNKLTVIHSYRAPKGGDPREWPVDLQVRELPRILPKRRIKALQTTQTTLL